MLWGNSPICSRLPYRYAMCLSFFAAYFIISSPSRGEMFSHPPIISDPAVIATQSLAGEGVSRQRVQVINIVLSVFAIIVLFFTSAHSAESTKEKISVAYASISPSMAGVWMAKEIGAFERH